MMSDNKKNAFDPAELLMQMMSRVVAKTLLSARLGELTATRKGAPEFSTKGSAEALASALEDAAKKLRDGTWTEARVIDVLTTAFELRNGMARASGALVELFGASDACDEDEDDEEAEAKDDNEEADSEDEEQPDGVTCCGCIQDFLCTAVSKGIITPAQAAAMDAMTGEDEDDDDPEKGEPTK